MTIVGLGGASIKIRRVDEFHVSGRVRSQSPKAGQIAIKIQPNPRLKTLIRKPVYCPSRPVFVMVHGQGGAQGAAIDGDVAAPLQSPVCEKTFPQFTRGLRDHGLRMCRVFLELNALYKSRYQ